MIVIVLYNISVCEEHLENYPRLLETLSLASWLNKSFLQGILPEIQKMIESSLTQAQEKVS